MRLSLVTAPSGGENFERMSRMRLPFDLLHRDEVQDLLDHAAKRRRVRHGDFGAEPSQAEALHHPPRRVRLADDAANLAHLELLHPAPPSVATGATGATSTAAAPGGASRMGFGGICVT